MQTQNTQNVENADQIGEIKRTRNIPRLSACHLGCNVRERIVKLMQFHESASRTATLVCQEFKGIRITERLVVEVMVLHNCQSAKTDAIIPLARRAA